MSQPRLLGGRYELDGVVGRGGMAEVHRARDARLDRMVAIKTLRSDLARDHTFQARFRREAQSAASLNHPSIIAVYDTGDDVIEGTSIPYIVMEYVDGRTLKELLDDGRRLLPERCLEMTEGILRALEYSHRNGIVHRDIKPANVMLTRQAEVKVMDFGIARAMDDAQATMTQTSQVIGTAQYLSPEQARGERVDARSDLYSTGCVMYELLTGQPPFTGDSPVSIAYQHVREAPVPPTDVDPEIPEWIEAIVLKAMAKDTDDRYQSAGEMREDIQRGLSGMPTEAATMAMAPATSALPPVQNGRDEDDYDDYGDRGGRGSGMLWALLALAVVAALVFLGWLLLQDSPETITVPDTEGMTVEEAEDALNEAGLTNIADEPEQQSSDDVEENLVVGTDPEAGEHIEEDVEIVIVVSSGSDAVEVPDLVGMGENAAIQELNDAGLRLGNTTQEETGEEDPGTVLGSSPSPGEEVAPETAVDLVVAAAITEVEVPDLGGMSQEQAQDALGEADLTGTFIGEPTGDVEPGQVVRQEPGAGTGVAPGSTVQVVIAEEPSEDEPPGNGPPDGPPGQEPGDGDDDDDEDDDGDDDDEGLFPGWQEDGPAPGND